MLLNRSRAHEIQFLINSGRLLAYYIPNTVYKTPLSITAGYNDFILLLIFFVFGCGGEVNLKLGRRQLDQTRRNPHH